jgi:hypothetical protein
MLFFSGTDGRLRFPLPAVAARDSCGSFSETSTSHSGSFFPDVVHTCVPSQLPFLILSRRCRNGQPRVLAIRAGTKAACESRTYDEGRYGTALTCPRTSFLLTRFLPGRSVGQSRDDRETLRSNTCSTSRARASLQTSPAS